MKRALLNKWIEELESGKWKQGKGHLHASDAYCCLGVLCEIAGLKKKTQYEVARYFYKDTSELSYLPAAFANEMKVTEDARLARLNDSGADFKTIAEELRFHYDRYMEVEDD